MVTDVRIASANRVTWVGFIVNLVLTTFKLMAGIVGHSGAMIADAAHSLSDFATDIVVLVGFRFVSRPVDRSHDYGHGKYETLATVVIGGALVVVGGGIFWNGVSKTWASLHGQSIPAPRAIALWAAVVSIITKEWLYRYTAVVGKRIESQAVIANAWHHRSDALSSVGTTIGIGGAILLGDRWHILDPLAAVVVSVFIIKVALTISSGSIRELMEGSLDDSTKAEIMHIAAGVHGVVEPHDLRTRRIGSNIAVDLHIYVTGDMCVSDAHALASQIENIIRDRFGPSTFVSIHVEPLSPIGAGTTVR